MLLQISRILWDARYNKPPCVFQKAMFSKTQQTSHSKTSRKPGMDSLQYLFVMFHCTSQKYRGEILVGLSRHGQYCARLSSGRRSTRRSLRSLRCAFDQGRDKVNSLFERVIMFLSGYSFTGTRDAARRSSLLLLQRNAGSTSLA